MTTGQKFAQALKDAQSTLPATSSLDTHDEFDAVFFRNYVLQHGIAAEAELGVVLAMTDIETLVKLYQDWRMKKPVDEPIGGRTYNAGAASGYPGRKISIPED